MLVETIKCLEDNFSYILIDENKNGCVVDPSEADPIIRFVEKNNINLKYILNTHHHYDHIGGNKEIKKKYNLKIVAYKNDIHRIPDVDILVEDKQIWIAENFKSKIIHIPGHTSGHICFYFENEKIAFTGDTLFSLGCGKIFEGSYDEMFNSLKKLKALPKETKIYFGHEYTLKNSEFCESLDKNNYELKKKILEIKNKIKNNIPTTPSTIRDEIACNIFFRAKTVNEFSKLRDLKDNF
tara:strand:- start:333 stop:1049 length:717 start_codon:yes stop_codon:yes gene_type:complete